MSKGLIDAIVDALYDCVVTDERVGRHGERLTARELDRTMRVCGCEGMVLRNVYIPTDDGRTSEIDVLLLTTRGVFVIESKNYSGWIFGNEGDRQWTQCLNARTKNRFYNPIWQNRGHVRWLREFLADDTPLHSLVVFSERCELKDVTVMSDDVRVIKRDALSATVRMMLESSEESLTADEVESLYQRLKPLCEVTRAQRARHVADVKESQRRTSAGSGQESRHAVADDVRQQRESTDATDVARDESRVCPRCGGTLVVRTARRGENAGRQFLGCSNFPTCRFTTDL